MRRDLMLLERLGACTDAMEYVGNAAGDAEAWAEAPYYWIAWLIDKLPFGRRRKAAALRKLVPSRPEDPTRAAFLDAVDAWLASEDADTEAIRAYTVVISPLRYDHAGRALFDLRWCALKGDASSFAYGIGQMAYWRANANVDGLADVGDILRAEFPLEEVMAAAERVAAAGGIEDNG